MLLNIPSYALNLFLLTSTAYVVDVAESSFDVTTGNGNGYDVWRSGPGDRYDNFISFPPDNDETVYALGWTVDEDAGMLRVAVAAESTGYVAFGIAESGGMPGSDIVAFSLLPDGSGKLVDYHALEYAAPVEDSCQDWTLSNHTATDDGILVWEGSRPLKTADAQDWDIVDDSSPDVPPTRIIGAWGDVNSEGLLGYHSSNRIKTALRFRGKSPGYGGKAFESHMKAEADGYFLLGATEYQVPTQRTDYKRFCFSISELVDDPEVDYHIIGFESIVDQAKNVHHLVIHASEEESECDLDTVIGEWARGNAPIELPDVAGFPMGGSKGYKSFEVEIHYDNPEGEEGIVDSSKMKVHYTRTLRKHDAGVFQTGDPFIGLYGRRVGGSGSGRMASHTFSCPSECTGSNFADNEVTVFSNYLHMHATGKRMTQEVLRDGELVHFTSVDYYDFSQTGGYTQQLPTFQLKKGDAFRTSCIYDADDEITFGQGSDEEMCITFTHYYPRQPIPADACLYEPSTAEFRGRRNLARLADAAEWLVPTRPDRNVLTAIGKNEAGKGGRSPVRREAETGGDKTEYSPLCECQGAPVFAEPCVSLLAAGCGDESVYSCADADEFLLENIICPAALCFAAAAGDDAGQVNCECGIYENYCTSVSPVCDSGFAPLELECPPPACSIGNCCSITIDWTEKELCLDRIDFIQEIECQQKYTKIDLAGEEDFGRVFGTEPTKCNAPQVPMGPPTVSPDAGQIPNGPPSASPDTGQVPNGSPTTPVTEPSSAVKIGAHVLVWSSFIVVLEIFYFGERYFV